jgi:hypothetical protein
MTRDPDDARLSAARPAGLGQSRQDAMFARIVARPGGPEDKEVAALVPKPHRLSRPAALTGAAAIAVVAGIGVPMALGTGSRPAHPGGDLHLAAYSLKLPTAYQVTDSTPKPCDPVLVAYPGGAGQWAPVQTRKVASAVAAGHCISMRLLGPFESVSSPTRPSWPHSGRRRPSRPEVLGLAPR